MKRPRVLQFTLLVTVVPSAVAYAGQLDTDKPVTIDINKSCLTVADIALPWLMRHRIQVDGPSPCKDQTCSFALHFLKMRNVLGLPIFNFNGRYVEGGKWHSFLTSPHVAGGYGEMTLKTKSASVCNLSFANFVFGTQIADNVSGGISDSDGASRSSVTHFFPMPGPDVKSNHRLENDYAKGIIAEVARR